MSDVYNRVEQYVKHKYPQALVFESHYELDHSTHAFYQHRLLHVAEPVAMPGHPDHVYCGLFLDIKRDGQVLQRSDGAWIDKYTAEEAEIIEHLQLLGYVAQFSRGVAEAIAYIDSYFEAAALTAGGEQS